MNKYLTFYLCSGVLVDKKLLSKKMNIVYRREQTSFIPRQKIDEKSYTALDYYTSNQ